MHRTLYAHVSCYYGFLRGALLPYSSIKFLYALLLAVVLYMIITVVSVSFMEMSIRLKLKHYCLSKLKRA